MRILFLTHAFNSLAQRLFHELSERGHEISVELDIADSVTEEAVALFRPALVLAPFLKRAIPASIWTTVPCFVVHPGIAGDRGPSALDWAMARGESRWGVTVLQAEADMDAGPIWASVEFPMRSVSKGALYRREVSDAALQAVLLALERFFGGNYVPQRVPGKAYPLMSQQVRKIDWQTQSTAEILTRIRAADGFPGVADELFGQPCHLFDAWPESRLSGPAGSLIARRESAICRATRDGALWIGHVKRPGSIKLPSSIAFPEASTLPEHALNNWNKVDYATWQDIAWEEADGVGFLAFNFYNGAMGTRQCERLNAAFRWATTRPVKVIVLLGGADFWSNGIHLNLIEAADENGSTAAEASWANINAIDDLAESILRCESQLTVAAVGANAGAGGCFLARACDQVWVRDGVILNPHYKNMGNLYGSEFWTYLLPPRVGHAGAQAIMQHRLPMGAAESVRLGFYDLCLPAASFAVDVARRTLELASHPEICGQLASKAQKRAADEAQKPLARYRQEELTEMQRNFFGFDPSYHVARYHFVLKSPHSWTPRHLARHRDLPQPTPDTRPT